MSTELSSRASRQPPQDTSRRSRRLDSERRACTGHPTCSSSKEAQPDNRHAPAGRAKSRSMAWHTLLPPMQPPRSGEGKRAVGGSSSSIRFPDARLRTSGMTTSTRWPWMRRMMRRTTTGTRTRSRSWVVVGASARLSSLPSAVVVRAIEMVHRSVWANLARDVDHSLIQ